MSVIHVKIDLNVCMMSLMTGPFKINGVPLRRVNQSYVIATSTKVDISGVNVEKFDDKYFAKEVTKKTKKGEREFFEEEKEVNFQVHVPSPVLHENNQLYLRTNQHNFHMK